MAQRKFNGTYSDRQLQRIAFPLGGIGAGMVCLEGAGSLGSISIRGRAEVFHEPMIFSALAIESRGKRVARLIEGPVPDWKLQFPWGKEFSSSGCGSGGKTYGLPRFAEARFASRFPFATVMLEDSKLPVSVEVTGWSPFIPGNPDDSSLPAAALEYTFRNRSDTPLRAVYSFHSRNFTRETSFDSLPKAEQPKQGVRGGHGGFVLYQNGNAEKPWAQSAFGAFVDSPGAKVNCRWFRGGWFDSATVAWKSVVDMQMPDAPEYTEGDPSAGGSLYVPLDLAPGESKSVRLRLAWHTPTTNLRCGKGLDDQAAEKSESAGARPTHHPWYAGRFKGVEEIDQYHRDNMERLRSESSAFSQSLYDMTLPAEVIEAVTANLSILKSPTLQRQTDGRLWLWEGCHDDGGSCHGSCTHVWNYAQAIAHLFPSLERSLRETEFGDDQDEAGHQNFRACLPIRPAAHEFHAAADGQLGGIMKLYRDWRISGDTDWLRRLWPAAKRSLDYCIRTWDPDHEGMLKEPHHNTYDIEFWGPDGMCCSFYAGALKAATLIGKALREATPLYDALLPKSIAYLERDLFNGEYFIQKIRWKDLHASSPAGAQAWNVNYAPEANALLAEEGPKYQYGNGCLSDGVLGDWIARACFVGPVLDANKVRSHLLSVYKYNFRRDLSDHANIQRPTYALGNEAGLLLCSWPRGDALTLPFVYSDEVWTGIEYQVASHLMMLGCVDEGLEIVRAVRSRYDGTIRNPFSEYECGQWYGRALASYGLLQGLTGQEYDAVKQTLNLSPRISGDFKSFISFDGGFGSVGMRGGKPFIEARQGKIDAKTTDVLR